MKIPGYNPSAAAPAGPAVPGEPVLNTAWDNALRQPVKQPSILEQGMQYAKQGMARAHNIAEIAAQKVMQNAGTIGKAGVGLGAALYSPGLNQGEQQRMNQIRAMQQPVQPVQPTMPQ